MDSWTAESALMRQYGRFLCHHGVKGQKWGVRNGPPYPIKRNRDTIVKDSIESGLVSATINPDKQKRHTKDGHPEGRSYINGDTGYAQELFNELHGTGEPVYDKKGNWLRKERVTAPHEAGVNVDNAGNETRTGALMIAYSKTGSHIYPRKEDRK